MYYWITAFRREFNYGLEDIKEILGNPAIISSCRSSEPVWYTIGRWVHIIVSAKRCLVLYGVCTHKTRDYRKYSTIWCLFLQVALLIMTEFQLQFTDSYGFGDESQLPCFEKQIILLFTIPELQYSSCQNQLLLNRPNLAKRLQNRHLQKKPGMHQTWGKS